MTGASVPISKERQSCDDQGCGRAALVWLENKRKNLKNLRARSERGNFEIGSLRGEAKLKLRAYYTEPVFLKVYGAQESIQRNEFRQPM